MEGIADGIANSRSTLEGFATQIHSKSQALQKGSRKFLDLGRTQYEMSSRKSSQAKNSQKEVGKDSARKGKEKENFKSAFSSQRKEDLNIILADGSDDELLLTEGSNHGSPRRTTQLRDIDADVKKSSLPSIKRRKKPENFDRRSSPHSTPTINSRDPVQNDATPLPKKTVGRPRPAHRGESGPSSMTAANKAYTKAANLVNPSKKGILRTLDTLQSSVNSIKTVELEVGDVAMDTSDSKRKRTTPKKSKKNPIDKLIQQQKSDNLKAMAEATPRPSKSRTMGKRRTRRVDTEAGTSRSSANLFGDESDGTCDDGDDDLAMSADDDVLSRGGLRPFPMSSQDFEGFKGISSEPPSRSPGTSSSSAKRNSGGSDRGLSKRPRKSDETVHDTSFGDFEDLSFMTQAADRPDPKTICPYCDEPLPTSPSPLLLRMLCRVRGSYPDPRPANALGRKAPLLNYVSTCQRHRFETTLLPQARAKGWPTTIKFAELPSRMLGLKTELETVLFSKETSEIWAELKEEINEKGLRKVLGIAGQFGGFEKSQTGYYGEQGSIIISQTLYNIFPLETIDAELVAPLSPSEFIQHVLVPEAAATLIQVDMGHKSKAESIKVLRESSPYGTAMFSDWDSREDGPVGDSLSNMDIGDKLVRERARAKRKEIEAKNAENLTHCNLTNGGSSTMPEERMRQRKGKEKAARNKGNAIQPTDSPSQSSSRSTGKQSSVKRLGKEAQSPDGDDKNTRRFAKTTISKPTAGRPRPKYGMFSDAVDAVENQEATVKTKSKVQKSKIITESICSESVVKKGKCGSAVDRKSSSKLAGSICPLQSTDRRAPNGTLLWHHDMTKQVASDDEGQMMFPSSSFSSGSEPPAVSQRSDGHNSNSWLLSDDVSFDSILN